jgi:putative transcriptional regulator
MASLVQLARQTIIALEQGKYVPSIELAFKIARSFGVTVEEVFQYEE